MSVFCYKLIRSPQVIHTRPIAPKSASEGLYLPQMRLSGNTAAFLEYRSGNALGKPYFMVHMKIRFVLTEIRAVCPKKRRQLDGLPVCHRHLNAADAGQLEALALCTNMGAGRSDCSAKREGAAKS